MNPRPNTAAEDEADAFLARNDMIPAPAVPGAWEGMDGGQLFSQSARLGRTLAITAPAALELVGAGLTTEGQDWYYEHVVDDVFGNAVDHWTPRGGEVGSAAQVVNGLFTVAGAVPQIIGTPTAFVASSGVDPAIDLINQGVDLGTASKVGAVNAMVNAIGLRLPAAFGQSLATRVVTGAGSNLALGGYADTVSSGVLEQGGYDAAAASYDPANLTARFLDTAMGAVFGVASKVRAPPSQRAAVLTANNADHFQRQTLPGEPITRAAHVQHQEHLETAIGQILNDEPVNVQGDLSAFKLRPELQPELPLAPMPRSTTFDAAVQDVLRAEGGYVNDPADRGGATSFGISSRANPDIDVANLTIEDAKALYRERYWDAIDADALPSAVRGIAFDAAVNQGVGWTRAALREAGGDPAALVKLREARYREIVANDPSQSRFLRGWLNRLNRFNETTDAGRALRQRLIDHPEQLAADYAARPDSRDGLILNTDIARELAPEYLADRTRSADVHEAASDIVKTLYDMRLAQPTPAGFERAVLFTGGGTGAGTGAGKSTSIGDGAGGPEIVYDTNMNTTASAVEKIDQALAAGRDVRIAYTYRDPVEALRLGALPRAMKQERKHGSGRTVPLSEQAATHVGSAQAVWELAALYADNPRVEFDFFDNSRGKGQQQAVPLDSLPQVAENGLHERLRASLDEAYAAGEISDAVYHGFLADTPRPANDGTVRPGARARAATAGDPAASGTGADAGQAGRPDVPPAAQVSAALDPEQFPVQGDDAVVVTERGLRLPVRYAVVDVAALVTSHDDALDVNPTFPVELQPRDRARAASAQQIAKIANDLNPELLAASPKAADGAPIIGQDKVVESGNARTLAVRRAYQSGKADAYRAFLVEQAARFGLDPAALDGIEQPMLVRVITAAHDRAEFARQANESTVARMSATEQANADAQRLPDLATLATNDDGSLNPRASAPFVRDFLTRAVSPSEQGDMMAADGALSQAGVARIRNAVFAKAYGDAGLVAMLVESTDANVKNVLAGMLRAAPDIARLRQMIAEGGRYPMDIVPDLVTAVRKFSQLRSQGSTVAHHLAQGDLLGDGGLTGRAKDLLRVVDEHARAPKRMAEFLQRYVDGVDALGDPRQADMLGGPQKAAGDVVARASAQTSAANAAPQPAGSLFNAAGRPTAEAKTPITSDNRAAYEAAAAMPDLVVIDADGNVRPASEVLAEAEEIHAQAERETRGVKAAVDCFLRTAA